MARPAATRHTALLATCVMCAGSLSLTGCADATAARCLDPETGQTLAPEPHLFSHRVRSSKAMRKFLKGADAVGGAALTAIENGLDDPDDALKPPPPHRKNPGGKQH